MKNLLSMYNYMITTGSRYYWNKHMDSGEESNDTPYDSPESWKDLKLLPRQ